jgi:multidrug efflux pump subunit AcrA (membrane-fusion protein)
MLIAGADASFGFDTSGQVSKLDVKIGDTVEAGQVIGHLHPIEALRYE